MFYVLIFAKIKKKAEKKADPLKQAKTPRLPILGIVVSQLCVGVVYLWSVFKADAIGYFGWEDGAVNLVSGFMLFLFCAGSFAGGALTGRLGPKKVSILGMLVFCAGLFLSSLLPKNASIVWFYLTYCLIGGAGVGLTFNAGVFCLQNWFPHKRGFASGLGTAAFGLGSVVFSPVIGALLKQMSIVAVLRTLSAAVLIVGMAACLVIREPDKAYLDALPKKPEKKEDLAAARSMTFREAVKTPPYWLMVAGLFFYNSTWNMLTPLVKGLGMSRGLTETAAILCVSLTGAFNALGRLVMSTWSDKLGRIRTVYLLSAITTACALLLIFVGKWVYFCVALLTVFAFGGPAAVFPATCTDLFGPAHSGTNYGSAMLALGLSSVVFNAVSNALYAATGTYTLTFLVGAVTGASTIGIYYAIDRSVKAHNAAQ